MQKEIYSADSKESLEKVLERLQACNCSLISVTEATNSSATIETNFLPTENVTSYIYNTRDLTNADQAGLEVEATQTGSLIERYGADCYAQSNDTMDNVGVGIQWQNILPKIDIDADYVYSKGAGETERQASGVIRFPDIKTELNSFKLYAQYNHSRSPPFRLRYWHEKFRFEILVTGWRRLGFPGLYEQPFHVRRQSEL